MQRTSRDWSYEQWQNFEQSIRAQLATAHSNSHAHKIIADAAWRVLRHYSTSFFIVTRFLPRQKRRDVELIYAAVRYPDEIVDTFPLDSSTKRTLLALWRTQYERALSYSSLLESVRAEVPPFVAGFADVVRRYGIPPEHYHAFLDAMEFDIAPQPFATFDDLIERYVYGSAIVVGYFLTYVYGTAPGQSMEEALHAARSLGIALQLTNFLRDVREDHERRRCYVPQQLLASVGISYEEFLAGTHPAATEKIIEHYARVAWSYYQDAEKHLEAFNASCIPAIGACIAVYGELTTMLEQAKQPNRRLSVPLHRKFACLPASKYWIVPVSLITPEYGR
ncbi:MAG: phytoene/squalene synthase family protein [Bacteroidota bacterium]|nr:phytoene/squalene synthase family protein [Chlorobiota bacterium]MDW8074742.1 phytoene/squalene synthase family protein [Bacteroidota bacterium]